MSTPQAPPVVPRPAATVIVTRPSPDSVELFMVRRDPNSRFAADAFVFPGGTVDPDDFVSGADPALPGPTVAAGRRRRAATLPGFWGRGCPMARGRPTVGCRRSTASGARRGRRSDGTNTVRWHWSR